MTSFEQAFGDTERGAASAAKAATGLAALARQMQRAAHDGDIGGMKRAAERLRGSLAALRQEVDNAIATWPFNDLAEEQYLNNEYAAELRAVATENGLDIFERDGRQWNIRFYFGKGPGLTFRHRDALRQQCNGTGERQRRDKTFGTKKVSPQQVITCSERISISGIDLLGLLKRRAGSLRLARPRQCDPELIVGLRQTRIELSSNLKLLDRLFPQVLLSVDDP